MEADLFIGELYTKEEDQAGLWYTNIKMKNQTVRFKLDTGSEANLIPCHMYNKLSGATLKPSMCKLITYSGHRIALEGETSIDISGQPIRFQVVQHGHPILGKRACVDLNMICWINEMTDGKDDHRATTEGCLSEKAKSMVSKVEDAFWGLGLIKTNAVIHVDPTILSVIDTICHSRQGT